MADFILFPIVIQFFLLQGCMKSNFQVIFTLLN